MTLKEKLNYLNETKTLIGNAIIGKGGTIDTTDFRGYANAINNLPSGGGDKIDVAENGLKFAYSTFSVVPDFFDFSNCESMNYMFYLNRHISKFNSDNNSKAIDTHYMFGNCEYLHPVSLAQTENVTDMHGMFSGCKKLDSLNLPHTENLLDARYMFNDCWMLYVINLPHTENLQKMNNMFFGWGGNTLNLQYLGNVDNISEAFAGCRDLENVTGFKDLGKVENISGTSSSRLYFCEALTVESLMNIINGLYDRKTAGYSGLKLDLGDTNLAKLTPDQIAVATNKGWTLI